MDIEMMMMMTSRFTSKFNGTNNFVFFSLVLHFQINLNNFFSEITFRLVPKTPKSHLYVILNVKM